MDVRSFPANTATGTVRQLVAAIPATDLEKIIDRVLYAVSPDEARLNLSGVNLEATKDLLTFFTPACSWRGD
jgi:DNA polymerase III sliding clamp (beta) subunit (PCNA family)